MSNIPGEKINVHVQIILPTVVPHINGSLEYSLPWSPCTSQFHVCTLPSNRLSYRWIWSMAATWIRSYRLQRHYDMYSKIVDSDGNF